MMLYTTAGTTPRFMALASEVDEKTLGMPGATRLNQYEFLVKEARESNPLA